MGRKREKHVKNRINLLYLKKIIWAKQKIIRTLGCALCILDEVVYNKYVVGLPLRSSMRAGRKWDVFK